MDKLIIFKSTTDTLKRIGIKMKNSNNYFTETINSYHHYRVIYSTELEEEWIKTNEKITDLDIDRLIRAVQRQGTDKCLIEDIIEEYEKLNEFKIHEIWTTQ